MSDRWRPGDVLVRREVLGLSPLGSRDTASRWQGKAWFACPVSVVEDTDEHLVTFLPPGARFGFADGEWPTADGRHPWVGRTSWHGHGCLMVQRPGEHHAVWHFWEGRDRTFSHWYVNLQTAFRRTDIGYDTNDLELDIVVRPDGTWRFKDRELLPARVREGRYSQQLVDWVIELGAELGAELDAGRRWWSDGWVDWTPDPAWRDLALPNGWSTAGPTDETGAPC